MLGSFPVPGLCGADTRDVAAYLFSTLQEAEPLLLQEILEHLSRAASGDSAGKLTLFLHADNYPEAFCTACDATGRGCGTTTGSVDDELRTAGSSDFRTTGSSGRRNNAGDERARSASISAGGTLAAPVSGAAGRPTRRRWLHAIVEPMLFDPGPASYETAGCPSRHAALSAHGMPTLGDSGVMRGRRRASLLRAGASGRSGSGDGAEAALWPSVAVIFEPKAYRHDMHLHSDEYNILPAAGARGAAAPASAAAVTAGTACIATSTNAAATTASAAAAAAAAVGAVHDRPIVTPPRAVESTAPTTTIPVPEDASDVWRGGACRTAAVVSDLASSTAAGWSEVQPVWPLQSSLRLTAGMASWQGRGGGAGGGTVAGAAGRSFNDVNRLREGMVLASLTPITTAVSADGGSVVIYQNASSVAYYGRRVQQPPAAAALTGQQPAAASSSAVPCTVADAPAPATLPCSAAATTGVVGGVDGVAIVGGEVTVAVAGKPAIMSANLLEELFRLEPHKLERMMEVCSEGCLWRGIIRVPPSCTSCNLSPLSCPTTPKAAVAAGAGGAAAGAAAVDATLGSAILCNHPVPATGEVSLRDQRDRALEGMCSPHEPATRDQRQQRQQPGASQTGQLLVGCPPPPHLYSCNNLAPPSLASSVTAAPVSFNSMATAENSGIAVAAAVSAAPAAATTAAPSVAVFAAAAAAAAASGTAGIAAELLSTAGCTSGSIDLGHVTTAANAGEGAGLLFAGVPQAGASQATTIVTDPLATSTWGLFMDTAEQQHHQGLDFGATLAALATVPAKRSATATSNSFRRQCLSSIHPDAARDGGTAGSGTAGSGAAPRKLAPWVPTAATRYSQRQQRLQQAKLLQLQATESKAAHEAEGADPAAAAAGVAAAVPPAALVGEFPVKLLRAFPAPRVPVGSCGTAAATAHSRAAAAAAAAAAGVSAGSQQLEMQQFGGASGDYNPLGPDASVGPQQQCQHAASNNAPRSLAGESMAKARASAATAAHSDGTAENGGGGAGRGGSLGYVSGGNGSLSVGWEASVTAPGGIRSWHRAMMMDEALTRRNAASAAGPARVHRSSQSASLENTLAPRPPPPQLRRAASRSMMEPGVSTAGTGGSTVARILAFTSSLPSTPSAVQVMLQQAVAGMAGSGAVSTRVVHSATVHSRVYTAMAQPQDVIPTATSRRTRTSSLCFVGDSAPAAATTASAGTSSSSTPCFVRSAITTTATTSTGTKMMLPSTVTAGMAAAGMTAASTAAASTAGYPSPGIVQEAIASCVIASSTSQQQQQQQPGAATANDSEPPATTAAALAAVSAGACAQQGGASRAPPVTFQSLRPPVTASRFTYGTRRWHRNSSQLQQAPAAGDANGATEPRTATAGVPAGGVPPLLRRNTASNDDDLYYCNVTAASVLGGTTAEPTAADRPPSHHAFSRVPGSSGPAEAARETANANLTAGSGGGGGGGGGGGSSGAASIGVGGGGGQQQELRMSASAENVSARTTVACSAGVAVVAAPGACSSGLLGGQLAGGGCGCTGCTCDRLQSPLQPGACWHEVVASPAVDPVTGQDVIILSQTDVSAKVEAERHIAMVSETEHRLLEQIFPRHVLAYMTEEDRTALGVPRRSPPSGGSGNSGARQQPSSLVRNITKLATSHSEVTLLFADIQGFTPMCEMLEPRKVMAFLNDLFTRFDRRLDEFGVYKVETIGDCYFVAGGLIHEDEYGMSAVRARDSNMDPLHAEKVLMFAKAMLAAASQVRLPTTGSPVKMRIGIHSGPVVSGLVGQRMPRFCLFGDTVNTASRMESTGVPGCIHASEAARNLLRNESWVPTGGIEVKGKGLMNTYLWAPPESDSYNALQLCRELAACRQSLSASSNNGRRPPQRHQQPPQQRRHIDRFHGGSAAGYTSDGFASESGASAGGLVDSSGGYTTTNNKTAMPHTNSSQPPPQQQQWALQQLHQQQLSRHNSGGGTSSGPGPSGAVIISRSNTATAAMLDSSSGGWAAELRASLGGGSVGDEDDSLLSLARLLLPKQ